MSNWKRRFFGGSNALIASCFTLIAFGFLYSISLDMRISADLSSEGLNTLEPETKAQLRLLEKEGLLLQITAFTAQSGRNDAFRKNQAIKDFLKRLSIESQSIEWSQVDYDKERFTAERLGVNEYGRVVLQRGEARIDLKERNLFRMQTVNGQRTAQFTGEAVISEAIARLMSDELPSVYVLSGHGEPSIKSVGPDGISDLASRIERDGYRIDTVQLLHSESGGDPEVPSDASLLLIVGPKSEITALENNAILTYLDAGGSVLYLGDTDCPLPEFLEGIGVQQPDGVAVDKKSLFPYWDRPIPTVLQHPITQDTVEGGYTMVLTHPAAFILPENSSVRFEPLLRLGPLAWIERGGIITAGAAAYEPEYDLKADMVQGFYVQLPKGGQIAAISDSEWVQNQLLDDVPASPTLIQGLIYALTGESRRLGLRPKVKIQPQVLLTKPQLSTVQFLSLIPMPLLIFLIGFGVWNRRRNQ